MYRKLMYEKYLSSKSLSNHDLEDNFNTEMALQKEVEDVLPKELDANIIDLGCGYGTFLNTLKGKGYKNLYGVEVGEEQNRFLNSKGLKVYQEDLVSFLKNTNERFELITLFDVLEHFKKDELVEIVALLNNKLTDSGALVVRVPNGEAIFKGSIMYGDFTHETFFTKRSMIQLFQTFGFRKIDVFPVFSFGNSWKAIIGRFIYASYVKVYKTLLMIDHGKSAEYFCPTQNIVGIIKK